MNFNRKIPAISVIIPMYNAEKFIGQCLQTIGAQTFKDFELIVVDDCSTDRSVEIVEEFVKNGGGGRRRGSSNCMRTPAALPFLAMSDSVSRAVSM